MNSAIKSAKSAHSANQFDKAEGNSKKTWKVINELRGKTKTQPSSKFIVDDTETSCKSTISEKFNEFFLSIAKQLNEDALSNSPFTDVNFSMDSEFLTYMPKRVNNSIFLEDCHPGEVEEIIKSYSNSKSSDISIYVLKSVSHIISPLLSRYYNDFMRRGEFPDITKVARVTPRYLKRGIRNCSKTTDLYPISPYWGRFLKRSFLTGYTASYPLRISYTTTSMGSENITHVAMH